MAAAAALAGGGAFYYAKANIVRMISSDPSSSSPRTMTQDGVALQTTHYSGSQWDQLLRNRHARVSGARVGRLITLQQHFVPPKSRRGLCNPLSHNAQNQGDHRPQN
ncbi:hypothetical protein [Tsuneonella flava]|uniref:hypothetical protein n=1 Tax=Tsuneonella flava TaxID=2055955 RepID=UPI00167FE2AB|nr:hypothetical protein [Tsuneonella flava]